MGGIPPEMPGIDTKGNLYGDMPIKGKEKQREISPEEQAKNFVEKRMEHMRPKTEDDEITLGLLRSQITKYPEMQMMKEEIEDKVAKYLIEFGGNVDEIDLNEMIEEEIHKMIRAF
jgi:hypothetical protein